MLDGHQSRHLRSSIEAVREAVESYISRRHGIIAPPIPEHEIVAILEAAGAVKAADESNRVQLPDVDSL